MVKQMVHEPFYSSGTMIDESLGVWAGWTAHQGSFTDCLPVRNETGDVSLLFGGENYADQSDLDQLRRRGHKFESHNASYLVHLYEEASAGFFKQLNGAFSGLIIDRRANQVVLFNDRYGLGRIYFHESPDGFYFASEAKAILKVFPELRRLDSRGLGELFACGCVLQNRTLFAGISLLPGGSAWTFRPGPVRKDSYFDKREWDDQPPLPETEYYEQLKSTVSRVLPRYFREPSKIAVSLTGGLDSRIIMAWLRPQPGQLPCYSHRGMFRECADARIARRVATICQQPHRVVTVDGNFFSEFPRLAERVVYLTDGTMDVSGATSLYVNRVARNEIAPIRMTGNYGGEVLRGVVMLGPAKLRNPFFTDDFAAHIQEGRATLSAERKAKTTSFIAFKQVPWHHYSRFALESSQLPIRSPYLDNELVALAYRAPADLTANQRLAERLIAEGNPRLAKFPTDRGPLGRSGLFGRLAERYQELTFKADYAYDYGMPHWLVNLDRVLAPMRLEKLFLGRHKYYHFRYGYRHQLAPYIKNVLLDGRALSRPYLDRNRVEKMVLDHTRGRGNYTSEIHVLLTTELIQRQFIEGN
jgi:asparagine synthase (glutamine-hydrolysing)